VFSVKPNVTWSFVEDVLTDTDFMRISMNWLPPLSSQPVPDPHPIVYTLLMRENNNAWQVIGQVSHVTINVSFVFLKH
jgi:hypothetical protein